MSYDIETCTWCNGEGIDLSRKGHTNPPACTRCQGSGKVYVTDEMATTKRRRKYMGPAPNEIEQQATAILADQLAAAVAIPERIKLDAKLPELNQPKKRGRKTNAERAAMKGH